MLYRPAWTGTLVNAEAFALVAIAWLLLARWGPPPWLVVIIGALLFAQGMGRNRAVGMGTSVTRFQAPFSPPALPGAQADARRFTSQMQAGASGVGFVNGRGQGLAIFDTDHTPAPSWKIAPTFLTGPPGRRSQPGPCPCA